MLAIISSTHPVFCVSLKGNHDPKCWIQHPTDFFFSVFTYICLTNYFTLFVFNFLTSRSFSYRLLLLLLRLSVTVSLRLPCSVVWALWCTRAPSQGCWRGGGCWNPPAAPLLYLLSAQNTSLPPGHYYEAAPIVGRGWRGAGMAFSNLHKGVITANGGSEVTSPESPAIPVRPSTFKVKIEPTGITDGKWPTMTASGDSLHHEIPCFCWKLAGLTPSVHLWPTRRDFLIAFQGL